MQRSLQRGKHRPGAFTMVEILVVITIIIALIGLSVGLYGNMMETARRAATLATIKKIDGLLREQINAWHFQYRGSNDVELRTGVYANMGYSGAAAEALALKDFYKWHFPQNAHDILSMPGSQSSVYQKWFEANWDSGAYRNAEANLPTISSELLYLSLTQGRVRSAAQVGADNFSGNELTDSDDDGFMEIIDGWGRPLQFYRWPTRLLNPFGFVAAELTSEIAPDYTGNIGITNAVGKPFSDVQADLRTVTDTATLYVVIGREIIEVDASGANLSVVTRGALSTDAERHPAGARVKLLPLRQIISMLFGSVNSSIAAHDPDDPIGDIMTRIMRLPVADRPAAVTTFENDFHTLDSYHAPLIVSGGTDGVVGLFEPWDRVNYGHLAAPDNSVDYKIVADPLNSTLNDNLTNQMEGLGN